jgi:DNA-binding Lrp family transcriptional regulator
MDLSDYLTHGLGMLPGVRRIRVHVVTRLFREASNWQLHALDVAQQQVLRAPPADHDPAQPLTRVDTELAVLLSGDGRMPIVDLARRLDVSEATVGRRLRRLLAGGRLALRAELAQPWTGRPVNFIVRARVPPDQLEAAGLALATLPGVRLCAATTGDAANLQLALWLRSVEETSRLESEIVRRVPSLRIHHRCLGLRYLKRMGQLIGPDGRGAGAVALQVWGPTG